MFQKSFFKFYSKDTKVAILAQVYRLRLSCRLQVQKFRSELSLDENESLVHCEATGHGHVGDPQA